MYVFSRVVFDSTVSCDVPDLHGRTASAEISIEKFGRLVLIFTAVMNYIYMRLFIIIKLELLISD
jgi:hypothetical protein